VDEGTADDGDPDWDDDVVPVDIHHNGQSSSCFVGTLFPALTDNLLRWVSTVF
jgi:hypothetical protein